MDQTEQSLPVLPLVLIKGNDLPTLDPIQQAVEPYMSTIIIGWWLAWIVVLMFVIRYAIRNGVYES